MQSRKPEAWLTEIFCSVQGEGPLVGVRQVFARLAGCHRRCRFCDTPAALLNHPKTWMRETARGRNRREPNPVSIARLEGILTGLRKDSSFHSIAFTGGEPLLQVDFLQAILPRLRRAGWRIYLETSGDRWHEFMQVLPQVDFVAMDIKLPSVTGQPGSWRAHQKFLKLAIERAATCVKLVVDRATAETELRRAARLIATVAPETPVILQPATSHVGMRTPTPLQLWRWQSLALVAGLHDVRVIPQVHVLMGQR